MILFLTSFLIVVAIFGSIKFALAVLLCGSMLGITPNGMDISAYLIFVLLIRDGFLNDIFRVGTLGLNPISKYLLLLLGLTAFSFLVFPITNGGKELALAYLRILMVVLLVSRVLKSFEDINSFIPYLWIILGLIFIHVYSQFLNINPFAELTMNKYGRLAPNNLSNRYVNSNTYAAYISMLLGLLLGFYKFLKIRVNNEAQSSAVNVVLILAFLLSLPILGVLGSRSNIALVFLVFVLSFLGINLKNLVFIVPALLLLLPAIAIQDFFLENDVPLLGEATNRRIDNIFSEFSDETDNSRLNLFNAAFQIFLENPVIGVGVGHEAYEIQRKLGVFNVSHNTYMNLLSELGLLGLFAVVYFFSIWRQYLSSSILIIFFLVVIAYGFTHEIKAMTFAWISMYLFWLMMWLEKRLTQS